MKLRSWDCRSRNNLIYIIYGLYKALRAENCVNFNIFKVVLNYIYYVKEYSKYIETNANPHFCTDIRFIYPCLSDNTFLTPLEPTYFFQDTWGARKIFGDKPLHHYDIGSNATTVGIISQFVPTTMIDIRPIDLKIPGLCFVKGSILEIPFSDNSLNSLSSLCVIEHIGLGRYGDPIDAFGSEKAAEELQRVLAPGGNLYVSMPVDSECRVYFNAHRAFTRKRILELFSQLMLVEEKYHYDRELCEQYDPGKGFGTGLFHFQKVS